jgi:hypothetical protein
MPDANCECSNKCNVVSPCRGCSECGWADWWDTDATGCKTYSQKRLDQRQKIIQKVVRVDSAQYAMNKAAMNVYQRKARTAFGLRFGSMYNYPSTMSDRREPHIVPETQAVHRHANSKHGSKTRAWPGMTSAAGVGVDVKHGSYARYLARKKGLELKAGNGAYKHSHKRSPTFEEMQQNPAITQGGKNVKFSIVSGGGNCECPANCVEFKNDDPNNAGIVNQFNQAVCVDTWEDITHDHTGTQNGMTQNGMIQNNSPQNGYFLIANDTNKGLRLSVFNNSDDRDQYAKDIYSNDQLHSGNHYEYYWRYKINNEFAIKLSGIPGINVNNTNNNGFTYTQLTTSTELLKALMFGGNIYRFSLPN